MLLQAPTGAEEPAANDGQVDDYNQWKQALGSGLATDSASLAALPGFEVQLLRSATAEEGSWISLAFDPQGRLIIAREDRGLLRSAAPPPSDVSEGAAIELSKIEDTLLECRGLLWAHDSLFVNANNSHGFYRLRDTDGDDQFDEVKLLRETGGGVGHGRNDLTLGPDGRIYLIHGNDVRLPDGFEPQASPLRNYAADRLLPCAWDNLLDDRSSTLPAGHVIRTDEEGKTWELVAGGLRNPFGIDFNADGEPFTYDADMEWDVGAPWYRPTRVNHLVSGADFGFRQGTGKWPAWMPDSLPTNVDIGLGSPTAVKFGTTSAFPPRYQRALFVLDWAYGRIIAVHLTAEGASYRCQPEMFVKGRPLNVTDLEFGPDGAMYFVTGGRGTQAGLYRVRYVGPPAPSPPETDEDRAQALAAAEARRLRRELEVFHVAVDPKAIELAWPVLDSDDPWLRHAARVAVERQPLAEWLEPALTETRPTAAATAMLALARCGQAEQATAFFERLAAWDWTAATTEQKKSMLRACGLGLLRLGMPAGEARGALVGRLDPLYPDADAVVNQQLCELLVYLQSATAPAKTLQLLGAATTQEEKLHYLFTLRHAKEGWAPEDRRTYFQWLVQAERFEGAQFMPIFVRQIKQDAAALLSEEDQRRLAPLLAASAPPAPAAPVLPRPLVREWKSDDLAGSLAEVDRGRNFEQGKQLYAAALCGRCHRLGAEGLAVGPDLAGVTGRFARRDLLEAVLSPSKFVDAKYRDTLIETSAGEVVIGRVLADDETGVTLATNPLQPDQQARIPRSEIEARSASLLSPMPPGLFNMLSKDEIMDLLAYIEAGGNPRHPSFE